MACSFVGVVLSTARVLSLCGMGCGCGTWVVSVRGGFGTLLGPEDSGLPGCLWSSWTALAAYGGGGLDGCGSCELNSGREH